MATRHTYYIAARKQCLGERASNATVCELLEHTWRDRAGADEPTIVDGVSAWIDDAGALQLRIVKNATAESFADPTLAERLLPLLRD